MIERQTAKKVRIRDIMSGKFVRKEGFEPNFVKTPLGEEVSRARVLGTIVSKFVTEDGNYASVTIDDGSDTIRLKVFKTTKPLDSFEIGDVVDVIGKVREYEGEIYIIPEVVRKVDDPNFEMLRRVELLRKEMAAKKVRELMEKGGDKDPEELRKELIEKHSIEACWVNALIGEGNGEKSERNELKTKILKAIESSPEGIVYSELVKKIGAEEADIEGVIDELLSEGICYEPSPGRIKKI